MNVLIDECGMMVIVVRFLFFFFSFFFWRGGHGVGYCSSHFVESIMWNKFQVFHLFSYNECGMMVIVVRV
jgi:hypothetical protein